MRQSRRGRGLAISTAVVLAAACGGDDDVVPVAEIPPDKPLTELNAAEQRGLCRWGQSLARDKLAGRSLDCNGIPLTFNRCIGVEEDCPATVSEWTGCVPELLDELFADPCLVLDFAFSETDFQAFIDETPGCEGLGACGTVTQQ